MNSLVTLSMSTSLSGLSAGASRSVFKVGKNACSSISWPRGHIVESAFKKAAIGCLNSSSPSATKRKTKWNALLRSQKKNCGHAEKEKKRKLREKGKEQEILKKRQRTRRLASLLNVPVTGLYHMTIKRESSAGDVIRHVRSSLHRPIIARLRILVDCKKHISCQSAKSTSQEYSSNSLNLRSTSSDSKQTFAVHFQGSIFNFLCIFLNQSFLTQRCLRHTIA